MDDLPDEPAEAIRAAAAQAGHRVTPVMLKKWRTIGLIPRPSQHSRGRGQGTETVYPTGSTAQLLRLLEIRADGGRFDPEQALWRLWWEGWPIEPRYVRALLEGTLSAWDRALTELANDDGAIVDAFAIAKLPPLLRRARKRAGTDAMPTVAALILNSMSGNAPTSWQDDNDASTLFRALGIEPAIHSLAPEKRRFMDDAAGTIQRFGLAVAPPALRDALDTATDIHLTATRYDLRAIVAAIQIIWRVVSFLFPKSNAGHDLMALTPEETFDALPGVVLCTLALRRDPTYAPLIEVMRDYGPIAAALARNIANDTEHGNRKPSRRLEPSEGTTQGRYSPCTTILASPYPPPARDPASSS